MPDLHFTVLEARAYVDARLERIIVRKTREGEPVLLNSLPEPERSWWHGFLVSRLVHIGIPPFEVPVRSSEPSASD